MLSNIYRELLYRADNFYFYLTAFSSCDPRELIKSLLPKDLSHRLSVLSFGVGVTMVEVEKALNYCIKNGIWLVLHNCHLAPRWSDSVLHIFKVLYITVTVVD